MENGGIEKKDSESSSYRYWVRNTTEDAAPLPLPHKIEHHVSHSHIGSAWNRAGTWEEKSLNNWAAPRIKELILSIGSIHFSSGTAQVEDVTKCLGDAFMVIVRNKKRFSYTYELTLKVKGEWIIHGDKKSVMGHIDFSEFSFGELDDLQMQISLGEASNISHHDKVEIRNDLKKFSQPVQEKLLQFEQELKHR
ncbi:hypothetical protein Lal_00044659 [Lupinus albus]|uniref:Putative activator of Hsp90 ATPase n=1 Tax=Lupinus albus TaxID=3870 RepID=A0A6A5LBV1_LUPAL|nr:putative activator of Hsp90 ATPase [Lupinus albus]KAF1858626.1 hypothetical protein Lal_00044659 [Lupinus albus]